ncbi:hypothetical protein [Streptosporangium canum]|uniref:hypothetical protein n=1 Tax=Streptosporangium canum TaxID=324952 RepID=UPI00379D47C2
MTNGAGREFPHGHDHSAGTGARPGASAQEPPFEIDGFAPPSVRVVASPQAHPDGISAGSAMRARQR